MSKYPEWYIELDGEVLGELRDAEFYEDFWVSYLLVSYSDEAQEIFLQEELWNQCKFQYRHKKKNKYVDAYSQWNPLEYYLETGRIIMRGFYIESRFDKIINAFFNVIGKILRI